MLKLVGEPDVPRSNLLAYLKNKTSQPDLEFIISCYYDITKALAARPGFPRLNPVPFILQVMHETGYLSSWWFLEHRNMAGIGVTGTTLAGSPGQKPASPGPYTDWQYDARQKLWKQGLSFAGIVPAVYAHLFHALAYVVPATDFGEMARFFNARYPLALKTRKGKPPAAVITDFNGAWAYPGPTYGQRIEAIYAAFLASPAGKAFDLP